MENADKLELNRVLLEDTTSASLSQMEFMRKISEHQLVTNHHKKLNN